MDANLVSLDLPAQLSWQIAPNLLVAIKKQLVVVILADQTGLSKRSAVIRCIGVVLWRGAQFHFSRYDPDRRTPKDTLKQTAHCGISRCRIAARRISGVRPRPERRVPCDLHGDLICFMDHWLFLPFLHNAFGMLPLICSHHTSSAVQ